MSAADPLYRQLRFAFILQVAGATMFGIAFIVRAVGLGFEPVTAIFGLITLLIVAAAVFTRRKMRDLAG
jgi:hypothetical protein